MLLPLFSCNKDEPDEETDVVFPTEPDYKDLDDNEYLTYHPLIVERLGNYAQKVQLFNGFSSIGGYQIDFWFLNFKNEPAEFLIYRTDGEPLNILNRDFDSSFPSSPTPVLRYERYFIDTKNNYNKIYDNWLDEKDLPEAKHAKIPEVGEKIITEDYELELINPSKLWVKLYPTNHANANFHTLCLYMLIGDLPIERVVDNKGRNVAITDEIEKKAWPSHGIKLEVNERLPTRSLQEIVMPFAVKTEIHKK